jgi:hypothetical protein
MISIVKQSSRVLTAPETNLFVTFIPFIRRQAQLALRNLRLQERDEAVSEVLANAFCAFRWLAQRSKLDVAYPVLRPPCRRGASTRRPARRQQAQPA